MHAEIFNMQQIPGGTWLINKAEAGIPQINHNQPSYKTESADPPSQVEAQKQILSLKPL